MTYKLEAPDVYAARAKLREAKAKYRAALDKYDAACKAKAESDDGPFSARWKAYDAMKAAFWNVDAAELDLRDAIRDARKERRA